ncbi:MAG: sigma-70 family RNA polymerase sigma factor [Eubacteriales bacterium]|nr:sigma-70 family RNA polymerase sigma factor [Eubacteriales bacterium]MDD4476431.1 sigma-70 family RNA polymerase sigma factor [Eubacteriales bacterium]
MTDYLFQLLYIYIDKNRGEVMVSLYNTSFVSEQDDFSNKVKLHGDMLYKICLVYLKNTQDAEDAVQETFYKLLCNKKPFSDALHEMRWLITVAKNICKNMLTKRRRMADCFENLVVPFNDPFDNDILSRVNALKDKYKDVIILYYFEGYSVDEIANLLKIGVSAVKMRLKRARNLLKVEIGETE